MIRALVQKYSFLIRYGVTGIVGAVLQTGVLYVWVSVLGLERYYLWGLVVGFCITIMVSFSLQKYWTFKDRPQQYRTYRQFVLYTLTALGGLGLNTLLLFVSKLVFEDLGFNFFKLWYLVAQVIIIAIVALVTFLTNYLITFKAEKKDRIST